MRIKDLAKTKTFWSGIGLVLYGSYMLAEGNIEEGVQNILTGLSVIFLRDAISKR